MMEMNFMLLLLTLCLSLIVFGFAATDLEGKATPNTGLDPKSLSTSKNDGNLNEKPGGLKPVVVDSKKVDQVDKDKDQVVGSKHGVENDKLNEGSSSEQKQVESKEEHVEDADKDGSVRKGDKKEKVNKGEETKGAAKGEPVRKEGSRGEECDTSNSCKVEKNGLVACLRIPGNDSPDLSLLIQNKGNDPLSVKISAPDFVQLEKTEVQLQQKEDQKVKVSVTKDGTDSLIVLTAESGSCTLDFRDLTSLNFRKETDDKRKSTDISLSKQPLLVAILVFAALLGITASGWMCVSFTRRHFNSNGSKYQKLDMELPVSGGARVESVLNDGWDNNWDDNWDDEEAPKTPSMPVTPSLSSKGLASRRLNKEGWKD